MHKVLVNRLFKLAQAKVSLAMTAIDLGHKATKQTNKPTNKEVSQMLYLSC